LAGALIALAETKEAGKREAWAKRGAAFFQGRARRTAPAVRTLPDQVLCDDDGYLIVGVFIAGWLISILVYRMRRFDEIGAELSHSGGAQEVL